MCDYIVFHTSSEIVLFSHSIISMGDMAAFDWDAICRNGSTSMVFDFK